MKPASGASGSDQSRGRAGRYSRTTQCPLAPPKPKELMPTMTGWSGNGSHSVCTAMGARAKSISGLGTWKLFDVGAKVRLCIIRITLSRAQWKAAASMCPRLLFTLETRSGTSRSRNRRTPVRWRCLRWVADCGSGRMRLDVVEVERGEAGARRGFAHQLDLAVVGGRADEAARREAGGAVGGAGRVHRRRLDHGVDRIAVALGRGQWLDGEDERALGAHVAVGCGIEGMAGAVRADDAHEVEAAAHPGAAEIGDGADERLIAVAARQGVHCRVQGGDPGGAGGAVGRRRPHEVEVVGDPVGQHREADAGDGILRDAVLRPPVGDGGNLRADENPGGAVAQRMEVPADMLDGLPRTVQQHPYLRLGLPQFVMGHAEKGAVKEQFVFVADEPLVRAREPTGARKFTYGQMASTITSAYRLLDDLAFAQQAPERRVRADAAGHAVAVPGDRNPAADVTSVHANKSRQEASLTPHQKKLLERKPALARIRLSAGNRAAFQACSIALPPLGRHVMSKSYRQQPHHLQYRILGRSISIADCGRKQDSPGPAAISPRSRPRPWRSPRSRFRARAARGP